MLSYHSNPAIKADILKQIAAHKAADEIAQGTYWQDGKGCSVGCTVHSDDHMEYERRFGIPVMLAHLEDIVFEHLPAEQAKEWPEAFMSAIPVGKDLSTVGWQFLWWLLTDAEATPGIRDRSVRDAIRQCADAVHPLTQGLAADARAAHHAKRSAERLLEHQDRGTTSSALIAAIRAMEAVPLQAALSSRAAALAAESVSRSAAWSATFHRVNRTTGSTAKEHKEAYTAQAGKLIQLLKSLA